MSYYLVFSQISTHHFAQNFGVVCAFGVLFCSSLFVFTEVNTKTTGYSTVVLYKRGTEIDDAARTTDEENISEKKDSDESPVTKVSPSASTLMASHIRTDDIFSFSHVTYTIPVSGHETKRLLDDVSGYVAPGKLTALMGESGAGKVSISLSSSPQRCCLPYCKDYFVECIGSESRRWSNHG